MTINITEIFTSLLGLLCTVIAVLVIPYIKSRLNAEQEENLAYWVEIAVLAAEGIFNQTNMGVEKFDYVLEFLEKKGFEVDEEEVEALIEASVYELINQFKDVSDDGETK